jgi:hypothetical protein
VGPGLRPLRRDPRLVGRANLPRGGATWARCARSAAICSGSAEGTSSLPRNHSETKPATIALRLSCTGRSIRDYAMIIEVAAKIPETILQEDSRLLMFYDNAATRLGAPVHRRGSEVGHADSLATPV